MRSSRGRRKSFSAQFSSGGLRSVSRGALLKNRARWFSVPGEVIPRRNVFVATLKQQARVAARVRPARLKVYLPGRPRVLRAVSKARRFLALPVRAKSWLKRPDVCVGRVVRRQVLFALGVGGFRRSPGGSGGYRRTQDSSVRC